MRGVEMGMRIRASVLNAIDCHRCDIKGCCKPGASQYYPILLKPNNYDVPGCTHNNINVFDIGPSTSATQYVQQSLGLICIPETIWQPKTPLLFPI